jgi:hypothetical protein
MHKRVLGTVFSLLIIFLATHATAQVKKRGRHRDMKKQDTIVVNIYDVDTLIRPVPLQRQLFTDKIDKEQRRADASDGEVDGKIEFGDDTLLSRILTKAILTDVNHIKVMIENMPANGRDAATDNQTRIRYLTAVYEMLRNFNADAKPDPFYYKKLVVNMHDLLIAANENRFIDFAHGHVNEYTLANGKMMYDVYPEVRAYLYVQLGKEDPKKMLERLAEYATDTFACNIIRDAAALSPAQVFNYAASTNYPLRSAVRRCTDPLVQTIVKIADEAKTPLKVLPFVSDIYYKRRTIKDIDAIADNQEAYFHALVKIKLQNDPLGRETYTDELAYRSLPYVREMDDLHESPENVRFKGIDNMTPVDLYYILIYGQDEIYTSSFLGTFKRLMQRMPPLAGNQLLDTVHYERFRTFIRMCAGYNTLSTFLGSMSETAKTTLVSDFIAGLQKGKENELEDAVDVADAFGSIRDSALSEFLQSKVKENYELSYTQRSKKGLVIYALLSLLFEGVKGNENDSEAVVQSQILGLPPINMVPYKTLVDNSGAVYEQVFFYGDEDGTKGYRDFMENFKGGKWKVETGQYWTRVESLDGNKIIIYANLPLDEPNDEDAQNKLAKYLEGQNIHPTVMIHRGHSYHLPLTLEKLNKYVHIVILGSCGGYHNLSVVLDHSPDAHIVSSKQTGAEAVNEPIIHALHERLQRGEDIRWIPMWQELEEYFAKKKDKDLLDKFSDYVPPYKNLGAIFIKAYRRRMNAGE